MLCKLFKKLPILNFDFICAFAVKYVLICNDNLWRSTIFLVAVPLNSNLIFMVKSSTLLGCTSA